MEDDYEDIKNFIKTFNTVSDRFQEKKKNLVFLKISIIVRYLLISRTMKLKTGTGYTKTKYIL